MNLSLNNSLIHKLQQRLDRCEAQSEDQDDKGYCAVTYSNNSMKFNIHHYPTEVCIPVETSQSQPNIVVNQNNDKIIERISELKSMISVISEKSSTEKSAIKEIIKEHDNEIQKIFDIVDNLENKINIFTNDLSHLHVGQEEHEILLKEIVTETQDNHKSIIMLTKIFEASRNALVNSVVSQRSPVQNENVNPSPSTEIKESQIRQSCLDISDYNGLDDFEDNGILEIQSCNSINSDDNAENEVKIETPNTHEKFKEAIEDRFEQILEVNKSIDSRQDNAISKSAVERSNTGTLKVNNKSVERSTFLNSSSARNANNFLFNPKAVTRSSVMMKSIIEERKIRSSNLNSNTAPINRLSTEILNESKVDSNTSEIERLKKEYFKINVMIQSIQLGIDRSLFNTELLWTNFKDKSEINSYHPYIQTEFKKLQSLNKIDTLSTIDLTSEEFINLSDLMQLKYDIYKKINTQTKNSMKEDNCKCTNLISHDQQILDSTVSTKHDTNKMALLNKVLQDSIKKKKLKNGFLYSYYFNIYCIE